MSWCFVVGTDTGVGKTAVSVGVLEEARAAGLRCLGLKPVETGCVPGATVPGATVPGASGGLGEAVGRGAAGSLGEAVGPGKAMGSAVLVGADARALAEAGALSDDEAGFVRLARPASPEAAAATAGIVLNRDALVEAVRRRFALPVEFGIVEGAGGLLVPMGAGWTLADFIADLGLPVLVVARAGLGTVNHTLLTLEALRRRQLRVLGFVLNDGIESVDPGFVLENGRAIAGHGESDYLGHSRTGADGRAVLPPELLGAIRARLEA